MLRVANRNWGEHSGPHKTRSGAPKNRSCKSDSVKLFCFHLSPFADDTLAIVALGIPHVQ